MEHGVRAAPDTRQASQPASQSVLRCPACGASNSTEVDSLATADLADLYRRRGLDVGAYFDAIPVIRRFRCDRARHRLDVEGLRGAEPQKTVEPGDDPPPARRPGHPG